MRTRRYILFLMVALLTFLIGLTAAVVFGHINPFAESRPRLVKETLIIPPVVTPSEHSCSHDFTVRSADGKTTTIQKVVTSTGSVTTITDGNGKTVQIKTAPDSTR